MTQNFNLSPEQGKSNPLLELASERFFQFSPAGRVIAESGMLDPQTLHEAELAIAAFNRPQGEQTVMAPEVQPSSQEVTDLGAVVMESTVMTGDDGMGVEPAENILTGSEDATSWLYEAPQGDIDYDAAA